MRAFMRNEDGAVTVDNGVLMGAMVGLGVAVSALVSDGIRDLSTDIRDTLLGIEISDSFRQTLEQICQAAGAGAGPAAAGPTGETYNGMPVNAMLIYQSADFVGGLPSEVMTRSASSTLELKPDAEPVLLYLADDDNMLQELDNTQVVAQDIELNGYTFGAGFDVSSAYTLSDPNSGLTMSSMHFGNPWDGNWMGPVMATAASNPLEPGESYTFDENITSHQNALSYSEYLGCG